MQKHLEQKMWKTRLPSTPDPVRRGLMLGVASAGLLALMPRGAYALTTGQAEQLVVRVSGEVQAVVNSGKSGSAAAREFVRIFQRYADVPRIAATLLGPPWRQASSSEKSAYVQALTGYLSRKYGRRFEDFRGGTVKVIGSKDLGRKGVIVSSVVSIPGSAPFPVEWHVIEAGGRQTFFDLIIDGLRLLAAERAEVRALYEKNGNSIAGLTQALGGVG